MAESSVLTVPGAEIYYRPAGAGPVLLILQGGSGDADTASSFVDCLTNAFTVVTYDRRGQSRSPIEDLSQPLSLAMASEDACALLSALSPEPAFVFGSSIGAVIALDLACRHPERIRALVAHEPPAPYLLPPSERPQGGAEILATYKRAGAAAATQQLAATFDANLNKGTREVSVQAEANRRFFFEHELPMLAGYRLDLPRLRAGGVRVIVGGGQESRNQWPYRCGLEIAVQLGSPLVEFPGDHTGYLDHPKPFADCLLRALAVASGEEPQPEDTAV